MASFHVPVSVSALLVCGNGSNCNKAEQFAGFAHWFSCPVCLYRGS